jgi:hypothetical protein
MFVSIAVNSKKTSPSIMKDIQLEYPTIKYDGFVGTDTFRMIDEGVPYILKFQYFNRNNYKKSFSDLTDLINNFFKEVGIMIRLQDDNLSPRIYYYKVFHNSVTNECIGVILMEHLLMVDKALEAEILHIKQDDDRSLYTSW